MEILKARGLTKVYKKFTAVDSLDMTIEKGDIYGFIGKNGAGKTTVMRMALTLAKPTEGMIELFGSNDLREGAKRCGSLIETPALPKNLTATELLKRYSILYGADVNKVNELVRLVGLEGHAAKKVGQYSLGMKQRLGIAVALINDPEFLLLDEPMNGLDPMGMKEMRDLIHMLNKEREITFLISSHLLEELSKTVTKIGIINNGHMVAERTMEQVLKECVRTISFEVDDVEKTCNILKEQFDENKITLLPNKVILSGAEEIAADINAKLVNNGIRVSAIEKAGYNLEEYFISKIENSKINADFKPDNKTSLENGDNNKGEN